MSDSAETPEVDAETQALVDKINLVDRADCVACRCLGTVIYVLRNTLRRCSDVLAGLLEMNEEPADELLLPDCTPRAFARFVSLIYPDFCHSQQTATAEFVMDVFPIAHKYDCTAQMEWCFMWAAEPSKKALEGRALDAVLLMDFLCRGAHAWGTAMDKQIAQRVFTPGKVQVAHLELLRPESMKRIIDAAVRKKYVRQHISSEQEQHILMFT
jgi:hypothetical protein